jgi:vitamin B12 transporter
MFWSPRRALLASASLLVFSSTIASAQTPGSATPGLSGAIPLDVTVTANRVPTSIQRTGSAITVISADEIARTHPGSLVDALRAVPGLDLSEGGGPGSTTTIRLRGANSGQTLVMIDGVRINDPSGPSGEFDASLLAPALIERIEVLRGPQSALYGSDAIGGVVNIITRKGRGQPRFSIGVEAGSYGMLQGTASVSGSSGPWTYAFSGSGTRNDGFSSLGYRIGSFESRFGKLEADGFNRFGGFGRIGFDPGNGFRFDVSALVVDTKKKIDDPFIALPDSPTAFTRNRLSQVAVTAELDTFERALVHKLQIFANQTRRFTLDGADLRYRYVGARTGGEYQARLALGAFGTLIGGARIERETLTSSEPDFSNFPAIGTARDSYAQTTQSLFALWQGQIGERLAVSLGGRRDQIIGADPFHTWRATAAYLIPETGTKLRASVGTGAKAPTLYQRFSDFGTPGLSAERSFGHDAGIDQTLLDGRLKLSVTAFSNRIRNLIDFDFGPGCPPAQQFSGCYVNVSQAKSEGIEANARAILIEGFLTASATYTHMRARDLQTGLALARRPAHSGRLSFQITPLAGWTVEPSLVVLSERFSTSNERQRLAPYARLDLFTSYQVNDTVQIHARIENITDARYQEVRNFGTTGRAFYAGLTATW